jgi:spore maturation protein CgeB
MRHMAGASNKPFDYMAAGLPLLVSDRPDWYEMFVVPGYARACNPGDPDSIATALTWFLEHQAERCAMAARGRARIETDWNYDAAFEPVMRSLS